MLDEDLSLEVVSDGEELDETETQFHIDMEREPEIMPRPANSTIGKTSNGCHDTETTPTDNGCRGEEATPPPCLGPSYSARRVMRNDMSESLDIQMRVLQCYLQATCYQHGKHHCISSGHNP